MIQGIQYGNSDRKQKGADVDQVCDRLGGCGLGDHDPAIGMTYQDRRPVEFGEGPTDDRGVGGQITLTTDTG